MKRTMVEGKKRMRKGSRKGLEEKEDADGGGVEEVLRNHFLIIAKSS